MAVVNVPSYRDMRVLSGGVETAEFVYDYALQGGSSSNQIAFFKAKEPMFIRHCFVQVLTALTSGSGLTAIEVGTSTGSSAALVATTAKAALGVANSVTVAGNMTGGVFYLSTDDVVQMTTSAGNLTAGKLKIVVSLMRATNV